MVFVGQINNKSDSQKGNEGVWLLNLLKFLHFEVVLVQWFITVFLLSAARQILQHPFYPLFCLF